MKKLNLPFLRNRTGYFLARVVVSIGFLAAMIFVVARSNSTTKAQGCTTDPVVANNLDSGAGSLRQAISDACIGSTITFNMATVTSPITLTSAELLINKTLTITGPGANSLTVQRSTAGGTPDFRIFNINGGVTVSISGLTLSNGRISGSFPGNYGGAIWNNHSTLTITDCIISGNHAVQVIPAGFGGGIFNDGANGGSATLSILNSRVTGNSATGNGGGIFNWGSFGSASLTITNSTISNNSAQSGGGGILSSGQSGNASVQIMQSAITGNTAPIGGGINNEGTQNGNAVLTIANSTISGNGATVIGGGIVNQGTTNTTGAPVTIINATITNNRVDIDDTFPGFKNGGAMFIFTGPVTIHNSIIARNFLGSTGTTADDIFNNDLAAGSSFNLIGTGGSGGLVNGVNNNLVGVADPLLGPLANNGGPTQTHQLLVGSPAIEAGTNCVVNNSCSPALGFSLTTDQRGAGFSRAADSIDAGTTQTVDIGAFEMRASVEDITDKSIPEDTFLSFGFNVADASAITNVSASSSNTVLVPNANLSVFGSGSTRTLNITPAPDQAGTTTITVTVTSDAESMSDTFVLTVTPVSDAPTDIALTNNTVADNSPSNTLVGIFASLDPDPLQTFTYSLVSGAGSVDNASFSISGEQLRTSSIFDFETKSIYTIRVRSTDSGSLSVEKQFIINVVDGPDNPGAIAFSSSGFSVGEGDGNANITLTRTGGTDNRVIAKVNLANVTTTSADYVFAPGRLDTSFNFGTGATSGSSALPQFVQPVVLQPDGKILIGGAFLFYNGVPRNRIARINPDGSLDALFNPGTGADDFVLCMALQADGKILIGGQFNFYDGTARFRLARLNANGTLDPTFGGAVPSDVVRSIVVQPDGKILIGGDFFLINGNSFNRVARLNSDGTLDFSFNPPLGSNGAVTSLALQPDGKIVVGGAFTSFGSATNTHIVRLESSGAMDATFNPALGISLAPRQVLLQPDGKILVAGEFVGNDTPFGSYGIARLQTNGAVDGSFDPVVGTSGNTISALALQPDSKIIIAGGFPTYNGIPVNGVARLNSTGSLDLSFNSGQGVNVPFPVRGIAIQPDGKIVIGGQYSFYDGVSSNGITRINGDLFVTWEPGDSANKSVSLPIVDDALDEPNETLSLQVVPLSGGATAGVPSLATLTILDNDPSPTAISAVSGSGTFGGTATLTATLTSGGSGVSGKTVSFAFFGSAVGNATTDASGVATLSGVSLSGINAGSYPNAVGASFAGDAINFSGSSGTGPLTVSKTTTTTTLSSSINPSDFGQTVILTVTVTGNGGTPTGSVQFKDGGSNLGSPVVLMAGVAVEGLISPTSGTHTITAEYSGDTNFLASTGTLAQVVKPKPTLSIDDVSVTEGNSGTTNLVFTVSLSATSAVTVIVNFATADGTATTSDNDYQSALIAVTFGPGELTKTVTVVVKGDQKSEVDETVLVNLSNPENADIADGQGVGTILNDDNLQLILEELGPAADQAAAFDSFLFTRDPFKVLSIADWFDFDGSTDRNTRVLIFVTNLTLNQGELPSSVVVNLVDSNNQTHDVPAEDVRALPNTAFTQVVFRLPDSLAPGVCHVTIKAQGRTSNTGTIRIAP